MERLVQDHLNALLGMPGGGLWAWMGTRPAEIAFVVLAIAWVLARPALRPWLLPAALAVALADLGVNRVIKPVFAEPRPCVARPELQTAPPDQPRRCGTDPAFPSSHAANTAALAAVTRSGPLAVASAVIGVQRVVTAQHDPGDVLAGWAFGAGLGLALRVGWRRLRRSRG